MRTDYERARIEREQAAKEDQRFDAVRVLRNMNKKKLIDDEATVELLDILGLLDVNSNTSTNTTIPKGWH